ncbi:hypothetical protein [Litorilituus lipolyticus]|uniref:Uncharacterized protein n=1 Tax=Litorilituus lipolyticus TaxID=2491017 RepID=A0A502KZ85_9GAMM|nr:hypothetical protein [Litorilituus lipolyticus]TPH13577.1 hypothetical protein EPA86_13320 [Litorilituus lipolyticus]
MHKHNRFLLIGAICSAIAAIAHLGCILFGAEWYRFFGAGEQMAMMAQEGHWYPVVVTSVISLMLIIWSLYGFSGSRVIPRLPLLKLGLVVISLIYIIRGIAFVAIMPMFPENSLTFWLISSGICLFIGLMYFVGTVQCWAFLNEKVTES